jgi:hypothetical protein
VHRSSSQHLPLPLLPLLRLAVSVHGVPSRETAVGHRNKSLVYGEVLPASINRHVLPGLAVNADLLLATGGYGSGGGGGAPTPPSQPPASARGGGRPPVSGTLARTFSLGSDASEGSEEADAAESRSGGGRRRRGVHDSGGRSSVEASPGGGSVASAASPGSGTRRGGRHGAGSAGGGNLPLAPFVEAGVDWSDVGTVLPGDVFYDLGSGTGKIPLQVALQAGVARSVGVEFARARHQLAEDAYGMLRDRTADELQAAVDRLVTGGAALPAGWTSARVAGRLKDAAGRVEAVCANFLTLDMSDATVVFVNNTVFEPCLMIPLLEVLAAMPRLRVLLTLRPLCSRHSARCVSKGEPCSAFAHPPIEGTCLVSGRCVPPPSHGAVNVRLGEGEGEGGVSPRCVVCGESLVAAARPVPPCPTPCSPLAQHRAPGGRLLRRTPVNGFQRRALSLV